MENLTQKDLEIRDQGIKKQEAQAEGILLTGKKELKYLGKSVFIRHLTLNEQVTMDNEYAKLMNRYIRNDEYMTKREMLDKLASKGVWNDDLETKLEEMRQIYQDICKEITSYDDAKPEERFNNPEFMDLLKKKDSMFVDFMKLYERKESLLEYTAEKMAEKALIPRQIAMSLEDENGKKIFASENDILTTKNTKEMINLIGECVMFWKGVDERFLEKSPADQTGEGATKESKTE